jgi:hypothetical protein
MGTPAYMSPEQAEGDLEKLGPRSDVYSLGATLYCLLTGKPPYAGDPMDVIPRVQRGDFPPPRAIDPSIDRALEAVCLKAMALNPEDRYGSCRALAEEIERWMADEPVTAWREPLPRRARRWARRNRTVVTGAAAAVLAGLFGLAAVAVVQSKARSALEAKNFQLTAANTATLRALDETTKAQAQTQAALAQSEASRQEAKAVNEFLTEDLLTQAEPANTAAEDHVSLLEVLDRAATKVGGRFAGQPAVEAALRRTIAGTYHGLASWAKAEAQWRSVREAARRRLGVESPEALTAAGELAHILRHRGRLDAEVLEMAKSAAEGLARVLGPDHLETLVSRNNLANAYQAAGRTTDAITLHEVNLNLRESKLGLDHPDTLTSRNNLATAYWAAGRTAEAITMHEGTLKLCESKLGPDHPHTLLSRNNLAMAYWAAGRTAEAITLHEATLKLFESQLGPDHPDTLLSRNNLAAAYRDAGRTAEAITLHEVTLKQRESQLGPDHPDTLLSRNNLAMTYQDAGRTAEALTLHEATLKLFESKLGPDHPNTLTSMNNLARAYQDAGRLSDALPLFEGALTRCRAKLGPDHPTKLRTMNNLAGAYLEARRWAEAESTARACLGLHQKKQPDDWWCYQTMSQLGAALAGQTKYAEAEPLIVQGYEGLKAREARIPASRKPSLTEAAARVVRLYEAWGKPDQATAWKARLGMPDLPTDAFAWP